MDEVVVTIELIKNEIPKHYDDPHYLSKAVIDLARLSYYENTLLAQAEMKERQAFLNAKNNGDKVTVGEAEADAIVQTENDYGLKKLNRESLDQFINGIKLRIRVLIGEKETV